MKEKLIKLIENSEDEALLILLTHFLDDVANKYNTVLEEENKNLKAENLYFRKQIFGDSDYPTTQCSHGCGAIVSDIPFETHDGMCQDCSEEYMKSLST